MALFEKGHKLATGRPKGSQNKTTSETKAFLTRISNKLGEKVEEDLDLMDPKDRVKIWLELQEYLIPKLSRTEITGEDGGMIEIQQTLKLENLGIDQLRDLERIAELAAYSPTDSSEGF
jgi:hypothetical protein